VQARVSPAIKASEHLRGRIRPDGDTKEPDKVGLRRIGQGYVYFRTANAESGLVTVDADTLILDEHDRHPPTTRGLAEHRLDSSEAPLTRFISTPTFPGVGIETEYLSGTRNRYMLTCPSCATVQPLDWEANVTVERGEDGAHRGQIECRECRKPMEAAIAAAWSGDVPGVWLPDNPGAPHASYHISHLYRPGADVGAIADAIESADANRVQNAWNQHLGLPFSPPGGQLSHEELKRLCTAPFRMGDLAGVQGCWMGVDVGARLHVWIMWDGEVQGVAGRFLVAALNVPSFDEVSALMRRYAVKVCVVDAHPELHAAGEFQMRHAGRVFLCTYVPERMPPLILGGAETDPKRRFRVQVDRTSALDAVFGRLRAQTITFPRDGETVPELFAHLMAPVRRLVTNAAGKTVARYDEGSRSDHLAHAYTYAELAAHIGGLVAPRETFDARQLVSLGSWDEGSR
jgi:hypothetical protein